MTTSDAGYIYVLINPSMEGLLKIGKTTRDPEGRAKELSAATGVPTPFYLAYKAFFGNCSLAEEYIHTRLEQKEYKVSRNREFFNAPLEDVIEIILEARKSTPDVRVINENDDCSDITRDHYGDELLDSFTLQDREPWRDVFELAEAAYYGLGDALQDDNEAIRLYRQAVKLGSPDACLRLGCIYRDNEYLRDSQQALTYFKEGVRRGMGECYPEMAALFAAKGQFDNADKCWSKFFGSDSFSSNHYNRGLYGYGYLQQVKLYGSPMNHKDTLLEIRDEILRSAERMLEKFQQDANIEMQIYEESFILFIRFTLYPEAPRNVTRGKVKWFEKDKGYGFIQQDYGEDVFLHEAEIVGGARLLREGQEVEFDIQKTQHGLRALNVLRVESTLKD
jgi:cold shock CspA family protein